MSVSYLSVFTAYYYRKLRMTLPICKGTKKDGQPCKFRAREGDYCKFHSPKDSKDCPICYEEIKGKDAKVTSCKHLFHRECLEKWTRENSTCPMCRTIIAPTAPKRPRPATTVYIRPFSFIENGRTYHISGSVFELTDY